MNTKKMYKKKKQNKHKKNRRLLAIFAVLIVTVIIFVNTKSNDETEYNEAEIYNESIEVNAIVKPEPKIDDWRITLVNYKNKLPDDYKFELVDIDEYRKFDSRAIYELNLMLNDIRLDGITNMWVQSSYRSLESQKYIFEDSVEKYIKKGMTREKAEFETMKTINIPGNSEHNLGLAVDFNSVSQSFDTLKCFKWLTKNAENYGFILRYPKDKVDITKVDYEPWHWRYIGVEHAKKINKLKFCLEEYIDYLNNEKHI